jgi:hypothetical protein
MDIKAFPDLLKGIMNNITISVSLCEELSLSFIGFYQYSFFWSGLSNENEYQQVTGGTFGSSLNSTNGFDNYSERRFHL